MSDLIRVRTEAGLTRITFDRPDRKNALNNAMYDAMTAALEAANADPEVRCVLLTGSPGAYCAGNDVKEFITDPPVTPDAPVFRMLGVLTTMDKVVVAAVNGLAVGIGATMLLHCDLVLAARSARFVFPFVNLGIVPEAASSLLLPQRVGRQRAMEMLLLGEAIDADQACSYGLVNRVVEDDALAAAADGLVAKLLAKPPQALQQIKRLMMSGTSTIRDRMAEENVALAERIVSAEGKAAIAALIARR